jgi:hypothetical protein
LLVFRKALKKPDSGECERGKVWSWEGNSRGEEKGERRKGAIKARKHVKKKQKTRVGGGVIFFLHAGESQAPESTQGDLSLPTRGRGG